MVFYREISTTTSRFFFFFFKLVVDGGGGLFIEKFPPQPLVHFSGEDGMGGWSFFFYRENSNHNLSGFFLL